MGLNVLRNSHERMSLIAAMLRSWTNHRVMPDAESVTGWKLEVGPFSGWAKLPESFSSQ